MRETAKSVARSERTFETGEGEQHGAAMIQLSWSSRLQTQPQVRSRELAAASNSVYGATD